MEVGIRDMVLGQLPSKHLLEGLRQLGLRSVELNLAEGKYVQKLDGEGTLDLEKEIDELEKTLNSEGIKISALLMGNNFLKEDREEEVDWAVSACKFAAQLNIPVVRIDAPGEKEGLSADEIKRIFSDSLKEIIDRTSQEEVDLGIENNGKIGNDPSFLQEIINAIASPRVGLTLDTGNFYWRGYPLSEMYNIINRLASYAKHTHVKNIAYPEELRETQREIGYKYGDYVSSIPEGDVDHKKVVSILKSAGYDRDLTIEDESLGKLSPEERASRLRKDTEYLQSLI